MTPSKLVDFSLKIDSIGICESHCQAGERYRSYFRWCKKIIFFYVVPSRSRKVVQSGVTLANRMEMDSRDKIRWIHAAVARQTRNRCRERSV